MILSLVRRNESLFLFPFLSQTSCMLTCALQPSHFQSIQPILPQKLFSISVCLFSPSNAVLAMLIYLRHLTRNQWKDRWKSHIAGMICLRSSCHAQRCLLHGKFHHCPLAACSARGMMLLDMTVSTLVAPDCLSSAPGMTE